MERGTGTAGGDAAVLARVLGRLSEVVDELVGLDMAGVDAGCCQELVGVLARAQHRLAAVQTRAARIVTDSSLVRDSGATSPGDLFGKAIGGDPGEGQAIARRAARIVPDSLVESTYAAGVLTGKQVDIITAALHRLPTDLPATDRNRCERVLVEAAQKYSLRDLRRQADRIAETYLPPVQADAAEADLVHAREAAA